jgi:CHAT domain-containing protein
LIPELMKGGVAAELPKELLVMGGVNYDSRDAAAEAANAVAPDAPLRPWERRNADALAMRSVAGNEPLKFLAGSDSEASFIRQMYEQAMQLPAGSDRVVQLRGAAATEEEFRRLAPQCYIMHLATHGFFARENALSAGGSEDDRAAGFEDSDSNYGYSVGLLSGLALAGANNPPEIPDDPALLDQMPDDGFLTADEIAVLPLGSAQLVVLSACDSGLGATAGGEGLLGVQRAFQVAGARTTIASLWMVNDEATRRIMEEFYRNYLDKKMSTLKALQEAQIWALNNPDLIPRGADAPPDEGRLERLPPQFWAAFTISGAWN